jgi:NADP-dependent 3-hydroxy acid dehydrogenase YdfG
LTVLVAELCRIKTIRMKNITNLIKGKVVAITGASSGIGEAIAIMLADHGAKVVLGARRSDRLAGLKNRITEAGGEAVYRVTDVKKRDDLDQLVQLASDEYGRLDVMINNAGISHLSRMDELQVENWEEMIDVNLKGTLYGMAAALAIFKKQGTGHIINIISTSGIKIVPLQGVYAGTKNAVRTIAEALRQESGGQYKVTGISPGFVQTELIDHIKDPAIKAAIKERSALIAILPNDIAGAVVYALSQPDTVDVGDIVIRPTVQD